MGGGRGRRQADMDGVFFIKNNLFVLVTCYLQLLSECLSITAF